MCQHHLCKVHWQIGMGGKQAVEALDEIVYDISMPFVAAAPSVPLFCMMFALIFSKQETRNHFHL